MSERPVIKHITLPFMRIAPYIKGLNPFSETDYPNEPIGWIEIPCVVNSDMSDNDILLQAINYRNVLINKWLELGNCTGTGKEDK